MPWAWRSCPHEFLSGSAILCSVPGAKRYVVRCSEGADQPRLFVSMSVSVVLVVSSTRVVTVSLVLQHVYSAMVQFYVSCCSTANCSLRRRDWMISDAGMQSVRRRTSSLDTCWLNIATIFTVTYFLYNAVDINRKQIGREYSTLPNPA